MSDECRYLRQGTAKGSGQISGLTGPRGAISQVCASALRREPCSQFDEKYWFSNDGFRLDDAGAIALANALDQAVNTDALRYEDALSGQQTAEDRAFQNLLVNGRRLGDVLPIPEGPWLIKRLRDLIAFLRNSGGFAIW